MVRAWIANPEKQTLSALLRCSFKARTWRALYGYVLKLHRQWQPWRSLHTCELSQECGDTAFGCGLFRTRGYKAHTWRALYVYVLKLHEQW
jgi:hypothetical protein